MGPLCQGLAKPDRNQACVIPVLGLSVLCAASCKLDIS